MNTNENHKSEFPKSELQVSSEIRQANRDLAEQRLRRLAEIQDVLDERCVVALERERTEILSHYREPQA